uniref:Protein transport protein sec16 n=1 Tax=Vitis vinifera TaxID=29760 RepID=A5AIF5_VITVI|nr:hypothetical protein VITISV_013511 [Vitis vinifera]
MASSPPFAVEDQTDEDFFDKLVEDEFTVPKSSPGFADSDDSDEVKAFANLSIGEAGTGFEDLGGEGGVEVKEEAGSMDAGAAHLGAHVEESGLASSNSFGFDSMVDSNNDLIGDKSMPDSTVIKSSESEDLGVKEVQWSSFYADSAQNESNGFGSYSDFFSELGVGAGDFPGGVEENLNNEARIASREGHRAYNAENSVNYGGGMNSSSGQWYQVDGYDVTANVQQGTETNSVSDCAALDGKSEVSYLQQTSQSVLGTVTETGTTENISNWNNLSQGNDKYPEHMVFDPQYPGWYYDTVAQEWRSLESYTSSVQSTIQAQGQQKENEVVGTATESGLTESISNWDQVAQGNNGYPEHMIFDPQYPGWYYDTIAQEWRLLETYTSSVQSTIQAQGQQNQNGVASTTQNSVSSTAQNGFFSTEAVAHNNDHTIYSSIMDQQKSLNFMGTVPLFEKEKASQIHNDANGISSLQSFPTANLSQQYNQPKLEQSEYMHLSTDYYSNQKPVNYAQQSFQSGNQFSYASNVGRSSAGRPPHALVTFGFGGKLIVMKDKSSLMDSSYVSQDPVKGSISVLNLTEVVTENGDPTKGCNYFRTLCQQSFPGPLVGGSVGSKELNKWTDERITNCESPDMDFRKGEVLRLLLSLLKIACQHYGKFRSPFGTDTIIKILRNIDAENDTPESAVAKLFASAKRNGAQFSGYGALTQCLQQLPSEGQIRVFRDSLSTLQYFYSQFVPLSLLVSGRKKEALHCAQEGQLWGPALVLAAQLGDQFYVDTVKQMAIRQLVPGSPLRTLCLLIAGQPADVFSTDSTTDVGIPGALIKSQQSAQFGANSMLDDWEENLAVITANRTKDDELVLIHLGDCLWKERSEIIAAHICYLVAEANFESYSDSARLCLVGADHWKFPRTYASPEAIQRTELYEYSKVLGNSQFVLLPFQPYKLIYAHMLAEAGKVSESLKYCQAVLKSLKTGRAPEVDMWRQLVASLEERIRTHQQGGYATNLAPAKLVGKLLNFIDNTAHRVVGGLPPPSQSTVQGNEHDHPLMGPRVSSSQSTMAMSSLMPSASMEPISEWTADGNRMTIPNRSVSEPDFGRTPRQADSSKEATSSNAQDNTSVSGRPSRFARFGFGSQLLQKTVGLVLKSRTDRQAKLGETNKFYYDEKLKRWVEEGTEPPAEEAALPPPPTNASFQNGMPDYNLKNALKNEGSVSNGIPEFKSPPSSELSSGIPSIPSSSNQFSARGRMGVRSRYVDTFNKGGGSPANLFQSPSVPSVKPTTGGANMKFFIPAMAPSGEQTLDATESMPEAAAAADENPSTSTLKDPINYQPLPPSSTTMQRFPSMDSIQNNGVMTNGNGSVSLQTQRPASWSGNFSDAFSPPNMAEIKPLARASSMSPSSSLMHLPMNGGSFGDDLHEVEL